MNKSSILMVSYIILFFVGITGAHAESRAFEGKIFDPGEKPPVDSMQTLAPGDHAPDFTLPSLHHGMVRLSDYKGKKNVVLSFVPAAWTPVCSDQWPGYNITRSAFEENNAVLLGITVDNIPTLHAWTLEMGELWFPVLSDFWPHGKAAKAYGVLRSDGTAERALVFINKLGVITKFHVEDINKRPDLEMIFRELKRFNDKS